MTFFKNKLFFPLVLGCAVIYGCGGGGGTTSTAVIPPPPPPPPAVCTSYMALTPTSKLKISVNVNGIYLISPNILRQYPFCLDPSGISLANFKLQNWDPTQVQVPPNLVDIPVNFDSQGNIEFYGVGVNRNDYTALNADYTDTNIYWLIPSLTTTPQMSFKTSVTGSSTTAPMTMTHQEQNISYWPGMLNGAGIDHWFWEVLALTSGSFFGNQYPFTINNYDSSYPSGPINLAVSLNSQINVSHSVYSFASPGFSGTLSWSTTSPYLFTTSISKGLTNGSPNIIQLGNNTLSDQIYFDWFELEYPGMALNDQLIFHGNIFSTNTYTMNVNGFSQGSIELFDISNPQIPKKFDSAIQVIPSGGGFRLSFGDTLAPGSNNYIALTSAQRKTPANITLASGVDLTKVTGTYDYLIITHESFWTNIQPLVTYRGNSTGGAHSVYVAKIGDVYDSYSGGIFTPQAIKDFISDAQIRTMTNLQYVLLVGDASFDYKNYLGFGQENFVPTALIDYSYGQTISDYWFVPNSTGKPLLAIGRLPAKTGTEADTMINKIINYETIYKPTTNSTWNKNVIFISGQDGSSTFDNESNNLISSSLFPSTKVNLNPIYYSNPSFSSTSSFSASIIGSINSGALITNYLGHGSVGVWANANIGQLSNYYLQSTDPFNFTNSTQLTFLVTLECLNGMFAGPNEGGVNPLSMSEAFLKSTGGAVGVFSPTGQGLTNFHSPLAQYLYNKIYGTGYTNVGETILGKAIQSAEHDILLSPSYTSSQQMLETISIFVLLGDPATQLALP